MGYALEEDFVDEFEDDSSVKPLLYVITNEAVAANRLIRISELHPTQGQGAHVSEFTYDGLWRRVEMKEKLGVVTVADRKFIWAGADIREERDASNATVKRFYGNGVQVVTGPLGGVYVYQRDHLGSIRGVLDGAGNVAASYDYDVWGNRTQTAGTFVADFGYAGYFEHQSGLKLTLYRGYSAGLGRWISRDPIAERGGLNLYAYGSSNPVTMIDPYGLFNTCEFGESLFNIGLNGLGMIAGVGLMGAPTGISQIIGLGVLARSSYGFGAGFSNLWDSFRADEGAPNFLEGDLVKDVAKQSFGDNLSAMREAQYLDWGLDALTAAGGGWAIMEGGVGINGNPFGPAFEMEGYASNPTDLGGWAAGVTAGDFANNAIGTGSGMMGKKSGFMRCGR